MMTDGALPIYTRSGADESVKIAEDSTPLPALHRLACPAPTPANNLYVPYNSRAKLDKAKTIDKYGKQGGGKGNMVSQGTPLG